MLQKDAPLVPSHSKCKSSFDLPVGSHIEPGGVRGYYIDMTSKAETPRWPPSWFPWPGYHRFIAAGQWGLGAYERFLDHRTDGWLTGALAAGRYLVDAQEPGGGWFEEEEYPATFHMRGPWLSAMAQGQCASLLVRLFLETGEGDFAGAARRALLPMSLDSADGGVQALLDGWPFPEEYPT